MWLQAVLESPLAQDEKLLCLYLHTHSTAHGELVWPGRPTIARHLAIAPDYLDDLIVSLQAAGWLDGHRLTMPKNANRQPQRAPKRKPFIPPTIAQIRQFCSDNNLSVDAEKFWNYYESNGWRVGKNKMKKWESAVRNWARKEDNPNAMFVPMVN